MSAWVYILSAPTVALAGGCFDKLSMRTVGGIGARAEQG